jgi:hypothetical protein
MLTDPFAFLGQLAEIQSRNAPTGTSGGSKQKTPPTPPTPRDVVPQTPPATPPAAKPATPAAPATAAPKAGKYEVRGASAKTQFDAELAALNARVTRGERVDPLEFTRARQRYDNAVAGAGAGIRLEEMYERQRQSRREEAARNRTKREAARAARPSTTTAPAAPAPAATTTAARGPDTTQTVGAVKPVSDDFLAAGQTSIEQENQRYLGNLANERLARTAVVDPLLRAINEQVARLRELARATPAGQVSQLAEPVKAPYVRGPGDVPLDDAPRQLPQPAPSQPIRPVGVETPYSTPPVPLRTDGYALNQNGVDLGFGAFRPPAQDPAYAQAARAVLSRPVYTEPDLFGSPVDFSDPNIQRRFEQDVRNEMLRNAPGQAATVSTPEAVRAEAARIPAFAPTGFEQVANVVGGPFAPGSGAFGAPMPGDMLAQLALTANSPTVSDYDRNEAAALLAASQMQGGMMDALTIAGGSGARSTATPRPAQGTSGPVTATPPARPRVNPRPEGPVITANPDAGPSFTTTRPVEPFGQVTALTESQVQAMLRDLGVSAPTPQNVRYDPLQNRFDIGGPNLRADNTIVSTSPLPGRGLGEVTTPTALGPMRGRDISRAPTGVLGPASPQGRVAQIQAQNATRDYVNRMLDGLAKLGVLPKSEEQAFLDATLRSSRRTPPNPQ